MNSLIRYGNPCPIAARGASVVIGNFDGVHLGHQALIKAADRHVVALTFEPHPKAYFSKQPLFRMTSFEEKTQLLLQNGVSHVACADFNEAFAALSPQEFINSVLINWLGAKEVITGEGFRFGKGRAGDGELLSDQFFSYKAVPPVLHDGLPISSSRIRKALSEGDLPRANALLGRDYAVTGEVIHGRKEGRELGYPTANIALSPDNGLKHGIYAVFIMINGVKHAGVASFGRRPMFDNGAPLLEAHIFDFKADLYGKNVQVQFIKYLRGEEKFDSLDALIVQMNEDSKQARRILN
jgi:riboflavin kinase / FMN adenylyltransferase